MDDATSGVGRVLVLPSLTWFRPDDAARRLATMSTQGVAPRFRGWIDSLVFEIESAPRPRLYYLEPVPAALATALASVDAWEDEDEAWDEDHAAGEPVSSSRLRWVGELNGMAVSEVDEGDGAGDEILARLPFASDTVRRGSTIILICGGAFVVMAVALAAIGGTASWLPQASQREHVIGGLLCAGIATAMIAPTMIRWLSWRRYWADLRRRFAE